MQQKTKINWLFKFTFLVQKYPLKKALSDFEKLVKIPISEQDKYQKKLAENIYQYHLKNNSWYQTFNRNVDSSDWKNIPILKKSDLQRPIESILSFPYKKNKVFLNNTSGSSGTPFYYAKDRYCHSITWANSIYLFGQYGVVFGSKLQARFYGIPANGFKYYKEKIKDFLAKRIRIPVFDLSDKKLEETIELFKRRPFYYVNGYTSSLVLFAKYLSNKGISAKEICPTLNVVFTTSEVCDEYDRQALEKGFGVKIVNEYGASELDLIAFEDEDGDWIVNNKTLLVEILDDNGNEVNPGEEGKVIVTSLFNKAMPFIRYELGDLAIKSHKTKDGYSILEKVTGRTNDFAVLPSGKKAAGLTFYYISKALMDNGDSMKEFIIKQTKINEFTFEYVSENELTANQKEKIQKALDTYLEPGLVSLFERKTTIERTKAGKLKHFHSLIID